MDLEQIEKLVEIIEKSTLKEITVEEGNLKINLKRENNSEIQNVQKNIERKTEIVEEPDEESFITSPIVGTFYSAASPETPAFVRVGDTVKKGQPVCIVEAMKLMNEINCDFDCEIEAVLVSNEQKVEYGQPLFRVKKI
ncbi:acetyl-CoA carboxylase biotin carboxyl carrier protein [Leptotrichia hongkongensis]|jgi:acetyl-coA carboxylase, biotin carboxyl carrier protein|uniref:Biotin carboxyl carrier protein of acetyl-CoA carboxylase n=1 Tax=Leptotrichia hongkongensis TaxID=554406 RepID=A0ABV4SAK3_9FUSO|nr:acetyl-CoA carboxylase biotin carboxyl carrier protein [uncultured Leptotrichia sp.]